MGKGFVAHHCNQANLSQYTITGYIGFRILLPVAAGYQLFLSPILDTTVSLAQTQKILQPASRPFTQADYAAKLENIILSILPQHYASANQAAQSVSQQILQTDKPMIIFERLHAACQIITEQLTALRYQASLLTGTDTHAGFGFSHGDLAEPKNIQIDIAKLVDTVIQYDDHPNTSDIDLCQKLNRCVWIVEPGGGYEVIHPEDIYQIHRATRQNYLSINK